MRSAAERTAVNTPIQGTAADMIEIAMIEAAMRDALPLEVPVVVDSGSGANWPEAH